MKQILNTLLFIIVTVFFSTTCFAYKAVRNQKKTDGSCLSISSDLILDLKKAQKIAIEQNPSIAATKNRIMQAKQRVKQAYSAYFPKIYINATGSRNWRSDSYTSTFYPESNPENLFSSNISGSWVLFDGFAKKFTKIIEMYGEDESRLSSENAKRLLLSAVASAYFNGQLALAKKTIAKADIKFNNRQLDNALAKKRVGAGSLSDVLNFKIQRNAAKTNLITAQKEYKTAIIGLVVLLGITDLKIFNNICLVKLDPEKEIETGLPDLKSLIKTATNNRADIIQAKYALKRTKATVKQSYSKFYPVVNLSGAVEAQRTKNMDFKNEDFGSFIAVNFKFNIFEGGSTIAGVNLAKAKKKEAENIFADIKNSVTADVLDAFEYLKSAKAALKMEQENQKLVKKNRNLVEKEYLAGQTSLVRLNEAQRDLVQANSRLVLSIVSVYRAATAIKTATGEILTLFKE